MRRELRATLLGLAQTLAIAAAFVGGGLAFAAATRGPDALWAAPATPYPGPAMPGRLWLVDGFNVIQVGLLAGRDREGWWRAERRAALLDAAARLAGPEDEVVVVFDGPRPAPAMDAGGGVRAVYAPSADEWLLERVRDGGAARELRVVTADRRLAARARSRGAEVVAPSAFLARCTAPSEASGDGAASRDEPGSSTRGVASPEGGWTRSRSS
jgi:hypothetical protein